MTMLIDANGISMKYPGSSRLVLDNVNFSINEGEFIVIAGDSGSGKSTLLAILGGILRPVEGVVKYKEKNMYEMNENEISDMHRSKVGYVPQSNIMLKTYSVLENIIVPYRLGTGEKSVSDLEERAHKHLDKLGIEDLFNRYPYELSGGELKRVSLARAMLMNPEIIIADEPTTGLDKNTGNVILEYLHSYSQTGKAVIVATHDMQVLEYGSRILKVERGRITKDECRI